MLCIFEINIVLTKYNNWNMMLKAFFLNKMHFCMSTHSICIQMEYGKNELKSIGPFYIDALCVTVCHFCNLDIINNTIIIFMSSWHCNTANLMIFKLRQLRMKWFICMIWAIPQSYCNM